MKSYKDFLIYNLNPLKDLAVQTNTETTVKSELREEKHNLNSFSHLCNINSKVCMLSYTSQKIKVSLFSLWKRIPLYATWREENPKKGWSPCRIVNQCKR